MKIGIMQPYFFPYLGYWQLMNEVDIFVIYDDVAYIKRGWINRNRIKANNVIQRIGIQIKNVSQNKKINELYLYRDKKEESKLFKSLEMAYKKAPYYNQTREIVENVFDCEEKNLARFLAHSIYLVAAYLKMNTQFIFSSDIEKDNSLRAQDKILDICSRLGADVYINAIGGRELYDKHKFSEREIQLYFLEMDHDIAYSQGKGAFIPDLSILDVLMYNSPEEIKGLLKRFSLQ